MRQLPQTNFDNVLSMIYESKIYNYQRRSKRKIVEEMLPALAPIAGALARGAAVGAVSNMMSDEDAEDAKEIDTDLVAHSEHIADDLAELGYKDDELVDLVQVYIKAAIETVLDDMEEFQFRRDADTDLVAHSEHIADDLAEMGYEDDKLIDLVQTYISAAIETALDAPDEFMY